VNPETNTRTTNTRTLTSKQPI